MLHLLVSCMSIYVCIWVFFVEYWVILSIIYLPRWESSSILDILASVTFGLNDYFLHKKSLKIDPVLRSVT